MFIFFLFVLWGGCGGELQYARVLPAGWDAGERDDWLRCLRDLGVSEEQKIETGKRELG